MLRLVFTSISTCFILLVLGMSCVQAQVQPLRLVGRTVATGMKIPWEIREAPDGLLWVSQRHGILERVHPDSGTRDTVLDIRHIVHYTNEMGLLGFALHPNFADTPIVVVSYVTQPNGHTIRFISRFRFDGVRLVDETPLFRHEPAGGYHQGCRIVFAPDRSLFVSMGDQPEQWLTMDSSSASGKMLHINLDGSIPDDNPFRGWPTWSMGHRNIQGLVYLPNGNLLASEHGNVIEDEVNLIRKGANYGWPLVEGRCDTEDEIEPCEQFNVVEPFWSSGVETYALSDMEFYNHDRYPALKNSILMATLKHSALMQLVMNEELDTVTHFNTLVHRAFGRLRDVCVTRDGRIFISTSNHDLISYYPFPRDDDDRIIELIPAPDSSVGVAVLPDTFELGAVVVGDSMIYDVVIGNSGEAPYTVNYLYMKSAVDTASIKHLTWRVPFVVMPGSTYVIQVEYRPTYKGEHLEEMELGISGVEHSGQHFIWFRGNTDAPFIRAVSDTVHATSMVDGTSQLRVEYENISDLPVQLDSLSVVGPHASEFTTVFEPPYIVLPATVFGITILHTPTSVGRREARVAMHSTSYRQPIVTLIAEGTASGVDDETDIDAVKGHQGKGADDIVDRVYVVDLLGRVVYDLHADVDADVDGVISSNMTLNNLAPGTYYRVTVTRKGVACELLQTATR